MNEMADLAMHLNDMNRGELRQSEPDLVEIVTLKPPLSVDDCLSIHSNVGSILTMVYSIVLSMEFLMMSKREITIRLMTEIYSACEKIICIFQFRPTDRFMIRNLIGIHLCHLSTSSVDPDEHQRNFSLADIWFYWISEAPSKWVQQVRKFLTQLPKVLANPKHLLINLQDLRDYDIMVWLTKLSKHNFTNLEHKILVVWASNG